MEKTDIAAKAHCINNRQDLLTLLNEVKIDILGEKAYPISMKQLCYYCDPNNIKHRYFDFEIPKKSGGKRRISAPVGGLKSILRCLNVVFQAMYQPSEYAMGFTQGLSVVDNARKHVDMNYVLNLDLKDFFPSICKSRVWGRLQVQPFNFSSDIAHILAGLCCMKKNNGDGGGCEYILPQGAPTSPIITNMICDKLDRRLAGLANKFNVNYSRYADDITFSSNHYVYSEQGEFWKELRRIIEDQNFKINEAKTRLQKRGDRQEVTGLTVCEKPNVTKAYVRNIRSLLYIWEKYGYSVAYNRFYPRYKADKGNVKKGEPNLENVLGGKLLYLKMVKGAEDKQYQTLQARFDKLVGVTNHVSYNSGNLIYLESMTFADFEKKFNTKIEFDKTKDGKTTAYFMDGDVQKTISVSSNIKDGVELSISLCENQNKKKFFLIHKTLPQKTSEPTIPKSNDTLIKELDDLLSSLLN